MEYNQKDTLLYDGDMYRINDVSIENNYIDITSKIVQYSDIWSLIPRSFIEQNINIPRRYYNDKIYIFTLSVIPNEEKIVDDLIFKILGEKKITYNHFFYDGHILKGNKLEKMNDVYILKSRQDKEIDSIPNQTEINNYKKELNEFIKIKEKELQEEGINK